MGKRLYEENKLKENSRKQALSVMIIILTVVLAFLCVNIVYTSRSMEAQISKMEEGKDYYREPVLISGKKVKTDTTNPDTGTTQERYYLYYNHTGQKMNVPGKVYEKYRVGDKMQAYTLDHVHYEYEKEMLLQDYKPNELKKCFAALDAVALCAFILLRIPFRRKSLC